MTRTAINPWPWSIPFGFNQAELVEQPTRVLACSGQAALDGDGNVLHAGDLAAQLADALDNLATVLAEAGMTMSDVVRITAYTTDVDAFIAARTERPVCAYTLVGVSRLAYPELLVELEALAIT